MHQISSRGHEARRQFFARARLCGCQHHHGAGGGLLPGVAAGTACRLEVQCASTQDSTLEHTVAFPTRQPNASRDVANVVTALPCAVLQQPNLTDILTSCRSGEDATLPALQNSPVYSFVQSCPGNCFQTVQPGTRPYSLQQRAGALAINFAKLLAVGTTASLVGVGVVNGLTVLRQAADPGWTPLNPPQNILATSLLYGTYMGVSSNLRSGRRAVVARGVYCRHISASAWLPSLCAFSVHRYQIIAGVLEGMLQM